jgi:hypothetical protein
VSYRDWTWNPVSFGCSKRGCCLNNRANGSWRSKASARGRALCWDHYQDALREEAARDSKEVLAERERIAAALMAWHDMWEKPQRVAFTDKKVKSSGMITTHWLKEFAGKMKDGTFGLPHGGGEPEPLYET